MAELQIPLPRRQIFLAAAPLPAIHSRDRILPTQVAEGAWYIGDLSGEGERVPFLSLKAITRNGEEAPALLPLSETEDR
jgi:hypothetical protein